MNKRIPLLPALWLLLAMLLAGCAATSAKDPTPVAPATAAPLPAASNAPGETGEDWPAAVVIYIGNQVHTVLPLVDDVITLDQGDGRVNEITITAEGVTMSRSTCENQRCVHQGEVTLDNYQTRVLGSYIICLPNQVTIDLVMQEEPAQ